MGALTPPPESLHMTMMQAAHPIRQGEPAPIAPPDVPPGDARDAPRRRERRLVMALALAAGLRVLGFAAAFPFFANTDEAWHYNNVVLWSQLSPPQDFSPIDRETVRAIAVMESPEYLQNPTPQDRHPVWRLSGKSRQDTLLAIEHHWTPVSNHEARQPPLYYAVAGAWRALFHGFDLHPGHRAYLVRFLNTVFMAILVGLAWAFACQVFPDDRRARLALTTTVAVFPQDAWYTITNDAPSAMLVGATLLLLLQAVARPQRARLVAAGLCAAAALMTKASNFMVAIPMAFALWHHVRRGGWVSRDRAHHRYAAMLLLAFALPVGLWMLTNLVTMGDLTGARLIAQHQGWTLKPWHTWLQHPIVAPANAWFFIREVLLSFWRGELIWHGARLQHAWCDGLYLGFTFIGLTGALAATVQSVRRRQGAQHPWYWCWTLLAAGGAFLLGNSLVWDFGHHFYPSAGSPYLISGRLISGLTIPFVALLVYGLRAVARGCRMPGAWLPVLAALWIASLVSEIGLTLPVASSAWNFFHLP